MEAFLKGTKRKWDETEYQSLTTILNERKQEVQKARDEVARLEVKVYEAKNAVRAMAVEKAKTQLKKFVNPTRCILCWKPVKETSHFGIEPGCDCGWHDHDYCHGEIYSTKAYKWVSMVPKTECVVCLYPELMPYATRHGRKYLNFKE